MKRCQRALEKLDGTFEQSGNIAEGGSDFCWECQELGNRKFRPGGSTMNENCDVNIGPFATSPDDPRYRPCGKVARFKVSDTRMCAEHYDEHARRMAVMGRTPEGEEHR